MIFDIKDRLQLLACHLWVFPKMCISIFIFGVGCFGLVMGVLASFDAHPAFIENTIFANGADVIFHSLYLLIMGGLGCASFYEDCFPKSDLNENHSSIEPTTDVIEILSSQMVNSSLDIS